MTAVLSHGWAAEGDPVDGGDTKSQPPTSRSSTRRSKTRAPARSKPHSQLAHIQSQLERNRRRSNGLRRAAERKERIRGWESEWHVIVVLVPALCLLLAGWTVGVFSEGSALLVGLLVGTGIVYGIGAWAYMFGRSPASYRQEIRRLRSARRRLHSKREKAWQADAKRLAKQAAREVNQGAAAAEHAEEGPGDTLEFGSQRDLDRWQRAKKVACAMGSDDPSVDRLARSGFCASILGKKGASIFRKMCSGRSTPSLKKFLGSSANLDKVGKLLTRKTTRGKVNIGIDMALHGGGKARTVADEALHSVNEGGFSPGKFLRYGNGSKLLGKKGSSLLDGFKSASSAANHLSSGSPIKAGKSAYRAGKKLSKLF